ncbi:MAG: FAD-dependent oxidoreductase [Tabrizicola sp.]|nr:FAD-dependent oxidoreductase [Tabrizicola sp.]
MSDRHVVIVGGGQAGGRIALSLREAGHQGPITLVADEAYPPYERPPLSKGVLVGDVEPETTLLASAAQLDQSGITLIAGVRASRLDALSRLLHLEDGRSLEFDALALATGARPRRFVPEGAVEPLPGLRSMDDALALRQRLLPGTTLAVIGGGVIGLELASSALACGARPVLIEAADRLMARQIGPAASAFVEARHRAAGTELHLGRTLRRIDPEANGVRLILDDGTVIAAGTVVAAIGVVPDTALAEAAGIACDDGILTDADGRTSQPGIWAAGDVARAVVPWSDRPERQESWRNAETQARRVAASILGSDPTAGDLIPGFWSDQLGQRLQSEGICAGTEIARASGDGRFAAFYLRDGRLSGCTVVDNPKLATLARRAIGRGLMIDPAALADPEADPLRLLR